MKDLSVVVGDAKFNYRVGLLIEKGSEFLVEVNPAFDYVVIPGGRVKTLESSSEALIREIKEEMGIDINEYEVEMISIIENFFEFENEKVHELFLVYRMKIEEDDMRFKNNMKNMDSVASYYEWVSKEDIKNIRLLPTVLEDAMNSKGFKRLVLKDIK